MQKNIKRLVMMAALSMPFLSQAGSGDLAGTYRKMQSIETAMSNDMGRQNLSNNYSGKLERNLNQLDGSLKKAANLSRSVRGSARGSIRGGSSSTEDLELLVSIAYEALDASALDQFPKAAQENLQEAIGDGLASLDNDFVDKANDVLDALDDSLGDDTTLRSNPSYRRKDNPAVRRVWQKRHHAKDYAQRQASRGSRRGVKRVKQSGRNGGSYQSSHRTSGNQGKKSYQTRAERQNSSKKPSVVTQQDENDAFTQLRNHKVFGKEIEFERPNEQKDTEAQRSARMDTFDTKVDEQRRADYLVKTPFDSKARAAARIAKCKAAGNCDPKAMD